MKQEDGVGLDALGDDNDNYLEIFGGVLAPENLATPKRSRVVSHAEGVLSAVARLFKGGEDESSSDPANNSGSVSLTRNESGCIVTRCRCVP